MAVQLNSHHSLSQEKALAFLSMDVWQVFKFWPLSVSDENRFLAFVKLWSPFDFLP